VLGQVLNLANISLCLCLFIFLNVCFLCPHFFDDGVEGHEVDVLEVVVGFRGSFEFFGGLSGIDSFEDAHFSEVFEGELELAYGFGSGDVLGDLSPFSCFDFSHGGLLML